MAVLENPRHEAFAQALAKGKSATDAMKEAGYSDPRNSSRLTKNDEIRRRVDELQQMVAERVVVDREWVLAKLIENAKNTQESNPAASNKALELIGKELGMFVDRSENINTNYTISADPITEEEWIGEHGTAH